MAARKKVDFSVPRPPVSCAHQACPKNATIREKTDTGWANFCEYHYLRFHRQKAEKWCQENGLITLADKVAFCRKILGKRITAEWDREPGSDDEPRKFMPGVEAKPVAGVDA